MNRRRFVQHSAAAGATLALAPADLVFPGTGALASVSDAQLARTAARLRAEGPCRAEVRSERGGPRLFVNGQEKVPFWGLSISLLETVENYKAMGMQMLQPQMGMMSAWTAPGQYDFRALERYLLRIATLAPNAYLFPRVQLLTPVWWKEAHPEETMQFGWDVPERYWDGWRTRPSDNPLREGDHHFTNFYGEAWEASYASTLWREDTGRMLQALVRFVDQSPIAARLMGYFFVHGNTEEWNVGGDNWMPGYEAPMQREAGPVPPPEARLDSSYGLLRDPAREAATIHFYRRFHEVRADTIAHLARAVKEATSRPVVTGTFFGYLMETPRMQESAHLAPQAVLDSPHVDVIACPYTYTATNDPARQRWESDLFDGAHRWLGRARGVGGDGGFRSMVESYRRRGKLYISEIDPGSYRHQARLWKEIGGSGSMTREGTVQILRRDLGNVLAANTGGWLYDFGPYNFSDWGLDEPTTPGGWYGGPEIIDAVGKALRLMQSRLAHDVSPLAEVAFVGDPAGFFVTQHWLRERPWPGQGIRYTDFFNHWFFNAQGRPLNRLGAPHDLLYLDDLTAEDCRRYKLILVPNAFLRTPAQVDALRAKLSGSGATVVWYYAPGLLTPEGVDRAQMTRLTGFRYDEIGDPGPLLVASDVPGLGPRTFGVESPHYYTPRYAVVPEDGVEALGHWTYAETRRAGDTRTAFARRAMDGWTSVFCGAPPLPVEILRRFAEDAGVRLWADRPAIVHGTRAGATVVCTDPGAEQRFTGDDTPLQAFGPLTVTLPVPMRLEGEGAARTTHTLDVRFGDVRLFVP